MGYNMDYVKCCFCGKDTMSIDDGTCSSCGKKDCRCALGLKTWIDYMNALEEGTLP